tara:strand:+ start:657 stop:776 length:120 start_codon:yes stop_codon:yes gene_type:complete
MKRSTKNGWRVSRGLGAIQLTPLVSPETVMGEIELVPLK